MKNIINFLTVILLVSTIASCSKEEDNNNDDNNIVTKYNCVSGTCVENVNGQYTSLQDCEDNCSTNNTGAYDCVSGNCEASSSGQYTTLSDCQTNCSVVSNDNYDCVSGNCEVDANGQYSSLADCQSNCSSPATNYDCVSGNCETAVNGQYTSLADCQASCSAISVGPCTGGSTTLVFGGQSYSIRQIGTQCWMTENVNVTTLGECFGGNTNAGCGADYGRLYTYAEAQNVCPNGWRLPTAQDFVTLIDYLGGPSVAGGKMKETNFWTPPHANATNESEFSARGGGFSRVFNGNRIYDGFNETARFWTSTQEQSNPGVAYQYIINRNSVTITEQLDNENQGLSCRCILE